MKKVLIAVLGLALINLTVPAIGSAAEKCPPELAQAKAALKTAEAALRKPTPIAKGQQDVQAPRVQAGSKSQEVQAPRSQDVQAPRSQDVQAPRSQDVQAPRSQDVQAPRGQEVQAPRSQQDIQAPRISKARALIRDSEAACKKGEMTLSAQKARDALAALK